MTMRTTISDMNGEMKSWSSERAPMPDPAKHWRGQARGALPADDAHSADSSSGVASQGRKDTKFF